MGDKKEFIDKLKEKVKTTLFDKDVEEKKVK